MSKGKIAALVVVGVVGTLLMFGLNFAFGAWGAKQGVAFAEYTASRERVVRHVIRDMDAPFPWGPWTFTHPKATTSGLEVQVISSFADGMREPMALLFIRNQLETLCNAHWVRRVIAKEGTVTLVFRGAVDDDAGEFRYGFTAGRCADVLNRR